MKSLKQEQTNILLSKKLTLSEFTIEMSKIGVYVVKPGSVVSMVYFTNEVRYFPTLDEFDIVVNGYFG